MEMKVNVMLRIANVSWKRSLVSAASKDFAAVLKLNSYSCIRESSPHTTSGALTSPKRTEVMAVKKSIHIPILH